MNELDRQAYDLGWDYATWRLDVPASAGRYFCDGYRAFQHGNSKKQQPADRYVRKWLQIRFGAWSRGKRFSPDISPDYLRRIMPAGGACPVTGAQFTYGACMETDWSVDRADNSKGYVRGNILIVSQRANAAKSDKSLQQIRELAAAGVDRDGLTAAEWARFALLIEPAFGVDGGDSNPVEVLAGQPLALGMPVSPVASFQIALSRAALLSWQPVPNVRTAIANCIGDIAFHVCRTRSQYKAMHKLFLEIRRRARHTPNYWEIWATGKVRKLLSRFLASLGNNGMVRLTELQDIALGTENTQIFRVD
ncbi:MAG TPA: hypothetical protein VFG91_02470 [Woeseiaceae bacterium]|nr:hypothetical protein [Woeseiaceae bacterium]